MKSSHQSLLRMIYAALCLALALVLPFLTAQVPEIGNKLCPMHIPVFLCGFLCGWPYGLAVGFIAPLLRSVLFGVPILFPQAFSMAFELATYGLVCALLFQLIKNKYLSVYLSLLLSMIAGRIVWGAVRFLIAGLGGTAFSFSAFLAGAVTNAVPGIILHIILVPLLVLALEKAHIIQRKS